MQAPDLNEKYIGLTSAQAESLLGRYGKNEIEVSTNTPLKILLKQFLSPLIYLLILAAIISFSASQTVDGVVVVAIIVINTWLGFKQEYQADQVYKKLTSLIASDVTVIRDGKRQSVDKKLLVPGDIVVLKLGDIVAADCYLIEQNELLIDESTLTGESVGVNKHLNPDSKSSMTSGILYSGSYVTKGTAIGKVFATGTKSEFGKIANLSTNTRKQSEYEVNLAHLSRGFMVVAIVFLLGLFVAHLLLNKQESLSDLLLFTLAIAITIIPEALPVVASITLATQAKKLGDKGVLVKRSAAIEDLGNVDLICSDKTGTLTENKMKIVEVIATDPYKLAKYGYLVSYGGSDPFDDAIVEFVHKHHADDAKFPEDVCEDIPFNPEHKFSGRKFADMIIYKGAPEYILNKSHKVLQAKTELTKIAEYSAKGYRAISVSVLAKGEKTPEYIGTYLLIDPVKADAAEVIARATHQGIHIKIITGDSLEVSAYVAKNVKLIIDESEAIEAADLNFDEPLKLVEQVEKYKVFARANPEQKYRIIQALQHNHHVGYLGDGINDAPSLKLANAAIVVNTASDVAKATADIIILTHSLEAIIDGIMDGRRAFENIDKYLKQTLVSNFGNFFTIGILSLFTNFLPMLPLQILINNLIVDIPEVTMSQDNVDPDQLRRPKQHNIARLFRFSVILGATSSLFDFIFFALATAAQLPPYMIQGLWFSYSTIEEVLVIFVIRTRKIIIQGSKPASTLIWTSAAAIAVTVVASIIGVPLLSIVQLTLGQIVLISILAVLCVLASEWVKNLLLQRSRLKVGHAG